MAAINEANGRNTFDPSKRIRGSLGDNFVSEANENALEKLKLVANTSAMRAPENDEIKMEENVKNPRFNITHTSDQVPYTPSKSIEAVTRKLYSYEYHKKNFLGYSKEDHKLPIINNVVGLIPTIIGDSTIRTVLETNKMSAKDGLKFGASTVSKFAIDTLTGLNKVEYNKKFEGLNFSKKDYKTINRVAFIESAKKAGVNVVKDTLVPTVAKVILNKALPKKVTENTIFKIAINDVNTLKIGSSIVGNILYSKYAEKVVDKGFKANASVVDVARSSAVIDLASRTTLSEIGVEGLINVGLRLSDIVNSKHEKKVDKTIESVSDLAKSVVKTPEVKTTVKKVTPSSKKVTK